MSEYKTQAYRDYVKAFEAYVADWKATPEGQECERIGCEIRTM